MLLMAVAAGFRLAGDLNAALAILAITFAVAFCLKDE